MRNKEGELTYHSRLCEGGSSIFISTETGQLVLIDNDRASFRRSPFINKYGETYNMKSKKWDNFYLDEANGGKHVYDEMRKIYMNF